MKKLNLLILEQLNKHDENPTMGKHFVVVDVQPEYEKYISFIPKLVNYINQNYETMSTLTFLYNGYDTLGMINESDYKYWWVEHGLDENIVDSANFYDKGYAFFRYCMDQSIDEDNIVNLVKFMHERDVNDTRDMSEEFWNEFIEIHGDEEIRELLEFSGDAINLPSLIDEIKNYRGIVLCGGGINECLKEVEIALKALDKPYGVLTKFTY
jgi:hypothetical protein